MNETLKIYENYIIRMQLIFDIDFQYLLGNAGILYMAENFSNHRGKKETGNHQVSEIFFLF